jgi:hypothetical protein
MPESVRTDYDEARDVVARSPRSAAGLLRLAIHKLVGEIDPGTDLNTAIGKLVAKGLDPMLTRTLDIVRVTGNNALHAGEMDLTDDRPRAVALFNLVNEITEAMIARPKRINAMYSALPEGAREQVERRDAGRK